MENKQNGIKAFWDKLTSVVLRRYVPTKLHGLLLLLAYALVEISIFTQIRPASVRPLFIGLLYSMLLAGICLSLPRLAGKIFFSISNMAAIVWALAQMAYYSIFNKMMWTSDVSYASDGVVFFGDVIDFYTSPIWWTWLAVMILVYAFVLLQWPRKEEESLHSTRRVLVGSAACLVILFTVKISGAANDPSLALGALPSYSNSGYYDLFVRDVWENKIESHMPGYEKKLAGYRSEIDEYFSERGCSGDNEMTGKFEGKNVIVVIMESLDDWMISPEEMPTVYSMMQEGIVLTDFYSPFYGTTRSINTETCLNTGIYFPTNGRYFYDFLDNSFEQSLPRVLAKAGYTSQIFHHNYPDYYKRTELIPVIGYEKYNSYIIDAGDETAAMNDCYPFDSAEMREEFFRDGPTFNMLITQAAHLPYSYEDPLSVYALEKHPEYFNAYGSEEEDCIRAKARLVDDTFARLLSELDIEGELEDTVIIALSDHYPYGYTDEAQMLEFANGADDLLALENTPCFIWSADIEPMNIDKTLNTSDLIPTIINLLGIETDNKYLGRDIFDPSYEGYAFFPDGSWACDGVICRNLMNDSKDGYRIALNKNQKSISDEWVSEMFERSNKHTVVSNLILLSDYYNSNN